MHKSADAVAANKSAGHAVGKSFKAAIMSPNGQRAVAAGVVFVGLVLANTAHNA